MSSHRLSAPPVAAGPVVVQPPPDLPRSTPGNPVARLLPVVMAVAMVGMLVLYFGSGGAAMRTPMFAVFPVLMLISAVGTVAFGARGANRVAEINEDRRAYLRYLDEVDAAATETAAAQQLSSNWSDPAPDGLWTLVGGARMWERAPGDPDFGRVRIGVGDLPLSTTLVAPEPVPVDRRDPVTSAALNGLLRRRARVPGLPVTVPVLESGSVTAAGGAARGLVRALICQLAVFHAPECLAIAVVGAPTGGTEWDWLKWLPHHQHPHVVDGTGPARRVYRSRADAERDHLMSGGDAHLVVIDDADADRAAPPAGVTVLLVEPAPHTIGGEGLRLALGPDDLAIDDGDAPVRFDTLTRSQAAQCARRLAGARSGSAAGVRRNAASGWSQLMGVADPATLDPPTRWRSAAGRPLRAIPIGVSDSGKPVELDIKEAAHGGTGPHGLCVGATGSGKSEFLRTLALGMVTAHPPEVLNLILVDFKGGATFLGLDRAPHVSAVITNLADEAHLVARMRDALSGEMNRRQELLRAAGNFANIADYASACHTVADLAPLPALLIVVDEFSELLTQHPDFAELFVAIGRVGRSLGMHLLLASQRVDEGRLRGLETHLSYRICLKTFSASESRAVIGVPDAYHLPATPGAALLQTATGEIARFHTAYVSAPHSAPARPAPPISADRPGIFIAGPGLTVREPSRRPAGPVRNLLDTVVDRMAGCGTPAHRVWLPPLTTSFPLSAVLAPDRTAPLTVPIGVVDCPFEQRRDPLIAALGDAQGNVAVVGGPRAGKSTAIRTLVLALAATHDPREVQIYGVDLGGGALASLRPLPHVGAVASRRDGDLIRRMVAEMEAIVHAREARFRAANIDSVAEYRATGRSADDPFGDVFLVVDGWAVLRQEYDLLEPRITALAAQGLSYGVHVVLTAARWADIRPALKDQIGTRIELRLGDPAESEMDRNRARHLVDGPPGRGITRDGRELVIALPRLDEAATTRRLVESIAASAQALRIRYQGRTAPPIELLPTHIDHQKVLSATTPPGGSALIGIDEARLQPVAVDFAEQSHLLVFGEGRCGKTSTLRTLCREVVRTNTAARARLQIVDFRRTLLGVVESEHLAGYAAAPSTAAGQLAGLVNLLRARLPGDDVSQQQLRDRSWWSGPEFYLVVDDYDLVAAASANPLAPLPELIPHARDIGLHLIVARRSGGAARAMFDPLLAGLRDLGCMGLLMSASPDEGPLLGAVRPVPLPPGRGTLLTRTDPARVIQVAWTDSP